MRALKVRAPTRIDLAGGTVDIWPLYLFHDNAMTVNAAIDLYAAVTVAETKDRRIKIVSKDLKVTFETGLDFRGLEKTPVEFIARIVKFYAPKTGLMMETDCASPAGAGLGGSSTLAIAVSHSMNHLLKKGFPEMFQLEAVRNIETRILGVPTGVQDYYPALYGGLNALHYGISGTIRERLKVDLNELQSRLVLCDTGRERQSGVSNWDMVKRYLDGDRRVRRAMEGICAASERMRTALLRKDFEGAGNALNDEWENRKKLSEKVTNGRIEKLIKTARRSGAIGGKVCGAGGGGCLVLFVKGGMKQSVGKALSEAGGRVMPFRICSRGVSLKK